MAFDSEHSPGIASLQVAGERQDVLRKLLEPLVQEAIEKEFERFIGAGRWERTSQRRDWRNGSRRRKLTTRVGRIELRIPRDRQGRFQPSLFERYQRSEQALVLALIDMYVLGVSTRKVGKVVETLCGVTVSASQVSALVKKLDGQLEAWRQRELLSQQYPYLIVDAHYEKVRLDAQIRSMAVLWVVGVREDGYREHLGSWTGVSESAETWGRVFHELVHRGLQGVRYVVSDEHAGLRQTLTRYFPEAAHQRCQVHYLRNLLGQAQSQRVFSGVKADLKEAWAAEDYSEAKRRIVIVIERVRPAHPRLAAWLEETFEETLHCYDLEDPMARHRLRSTNGLEHEHKEIRRRTRVVGIFPNPESLLRLVTALAIERCEQWALMRYLMIDPAAKLHRAWKVAMNAT